MLWQITELEGFKKLLKLLDILHILSVSDEVEIISSCITTGFNSKDAHRMNIIFDYVMANFMGEISLPIVADMVNMGQTSFSRYFKSRNLKSFSDFVSEIRLGHASKLLIENEKNIGEICFESGFNNISNFNRQFRNKYGTNPLEFKKRYKM